MTPKGHKYDCGCFVCKRNRDDMSQTMVGGLVVLILIIGLMSKACGW
jgi:hypothetical protein